MIIQRFGEDLLKWFMGLIRDYITWGAVEESGEKVQLTPDYHYILEGMLIELIGNLRFCNNDAAENY